MDWSELGNWPEYSKILIAVFALVSPPIVIPLFMGVVAGRPMPEKIATGYIGALAFGVTMWAFIFFGHAILDLFGITIPAFRIAGGILLMLIALSMMQAEAPENVADTDEARSTSVFAAAVVPLAIPILAGPGAISTVVVFSSVHEGIEHQILVAGVILVLVIYLAILFRILAATGSLIGRNTTIIFNKVMGLIICAIAVEFILDGIAGHFPGLNTIH